MRAITMKLTDVENGESILNGSPAQRRKFCALLTEFAQLSLNTDKTDVSQNFKERLTAGAKAFGSLFLTCAATVGLAYFLDRFTRISSSLGQAFVYGSFLPASVGFKMWNYLDKFDSTNSAAKENVDAKIINKLSELKYELLNLGRKMGIDDLPEFVKNLDIKSFTEEEIKYDDRRLIANESKVLAELFDRETSLAQAVPKRPKTR